MKPQLWLPPVVFLAVAIPVVMVLGALELVPDYRVSIALATGVVATAFVQHQLKARARGDNQ